MIQNDTIRLLRECSAGIKMGIQSIDDVMNDVEQVRLRDILQTAKNKHEELEQRTHEILKEYHDEEKEPNPIARGMAAMKTGMKMAMGKSSQSAANLMTDGCNMGVKSMNRYLNQYPEAEERAKKIAGELIAIETELAKSVKSFL